MSEPPRTAPDEIPEELRRSYRSLLDDMHLALLSEIGARAIHDHMSRHVRDETLRALLTKLNQEGAASVASLRELMIGMGGRPRRTSFRRRALARLLALGSRVIGPRLVMRICRDAAETVANWYGEYALFLRRLGDEERADTCDRLQEIKRLHAQALSAWVVNLPRR